LITVAKAILSGNLPKVIETIGYVSPVMLASAVPVGGCLEYAQSEVIFRNRLSQSLLVRVAAMLSSDPDYSERPITGYYSYLVRTFLSATGSGYIRTILALAPLGDALATASYFDDSRSYVLMGLLSEAISKRNVYVLLDALANTSMRVLKMIRHHDGILTFAAHAPQGLLTCQNSFLAQILAILPKMSALRPLVKFYRAELGTISQPGSYNRELFELSVVVFRACDSRDMQSALHAVSRARSELSHFYRTPNGSGGYNIKVIRDSSELDNEEVYRGHLYYAAGTLLETSPTDEVKRVGLWLLDHLRRLKSFMDTPARAPPQLVGVCVPRRPGAAYVEDVKDVKDVEVVEVADDADDAEAVEAAAGVLLSMAQARREPDEGDSRPAKRRKTAK
jgi:hypothetical protein